MAVVLQLLHDQVRSGNAANSTLARSGNADNSTLARSGNAANICHSITA